MVELFLFITAVLVYNLTLMAFEVSFIPYNRSDSPVLRFLNQPTRDILDLIIYIGIINLFYYQSMRIKRESKVDLELSEDISD